MRASIAIFVLIFTTSCGSMVKQDHSSLIPDPKPNTNANTLLTEQEIAHDLETLRLALNKGYAGKNVMPRDQFKKIFSKLDNIRGVRLAQNLCAELADNLAEIADSQMYFEFRGKRCNTQPPGKPGEVGANSILKRKAAGIWNVRVEPRGPFSMVMISFTKLPKRQDVAWKGFIPAVKAADAHAQAFAIDLRGLDRGDDAIGMELAQLLNGAKLKMPYSAKWTNESPEAAQLRLNLVEKDVNRLHARKMIVSKALLASQKSLTAQRDAAITERKTSSEATVDGADFDPAKHPKKPIYILIDAKCAGACERTVQAFMLNPNVKIVGENTAGDLTFSNLGAVNLKNSGIWAVLPTSHMVYPGGHFYEKVGIAPSIVAAKGSDAIFYLGH